MSKLKQELYILCGKYISNREIEIKKTIAEAQEAANNETKSSAGDKFETGRESMQQEIDLNLSRLGELNKLKQTLDRIIPAQHNSTVSPGAVAFTSNGNYYIAIGAGKLVVDGAVFYAISPDSPMGTKLSGQKSGYAYSLNGKDYLIESVI